MCNYLYGVYSMNKRLKKQNGFTLAEMLVTLLVISVLAIVTVPLVKKTKLIMDEGHTKNSWAAMWEGNQLVVYENGKRNVYSSNSPYFVNSTTAKFTPPQGAQNFNVLVVGGGGGGAAGVSLPGFSKQYFADNNGEENAFVAPNDGKYRMIAIGGGGGGAGGAPLCSGESGQSGGGVIATVDLKKNDRLAVVVGLGGSRGDNKTIGEQIAMLATPLTKIVLTAAACLVLPELAPALIMSAKISVASTAISEVVATSNLLNVGGNKQTVTTPGSEFFGTDTVTKLEGMGLGGEWADYEMLMGEVTCVAKAPQTVNVPRDSLKFNAGKMNTGNVEVNAAASAGPAIVSLGIEVIGNIIGGILTPSNDWMRGGGHGLGTVIYGGGNIFGDGSDSKVKIIAGGGAGGRYKDKSWHRWTYKCRPNGRGDAMDVSDETTVEGTAIDTKSILQSNTDDRWFCMADNGNLLGGIRSSFCKELNKTISGGPISSAMTYGNGGKNGGKSSKGKRGADGYAEITEINAYGGGGGQAGAVAIHTFEKLPPVSLSVVVGQGGEGGEVADTAGSVTASQQKGQDGGFSSFGSKILAAGGTGGQLRASATEEDRYKNAYKSKGQDGLVSAIDSQTKKRLPSGLTSVFKGDYSKAGQGESSSKKGYPGIGGAGGAAYANIDSKVNRAYEGGNGAPGLVLVTW